MGNRNENDRNQQTGGKSNQQSQEDQKRPVDPNNPTAKQGNQQGQQQGKQQQRPGSQQPSNTEVDEPEESRDETTYETIIQRKPGESEADFQKRKADLLGKKK